MEVCQCTLLRHLIVTMCKTTRNVLDVGDTYRNSFYDLDLEHQMNDKVLEMIGVGNCI